MYSGAKDLEQFHKNAADATGFSKTRRNSSSRLILLVRVLFICRIQSGGQNILDPGATVAPCTGSILVPQELVRNAHS